MARLLCAKRFLSSSSSSLSLLSSSSSSKCCYSTTSTSEHSSINSFLLFSPQQLITASTSLTCGPQDVLPGCDFKHWFILMHRPPPHLTRDDIITSYINTLAIVLGCWKKARMKIYSVSTRYYYAFGAEIPEETALKMRGLTNVGLVVPDFYMNVPTKDYGGEPFINGKPVPYDPKYHEVYLKNRERAKRFLMQQMEKRQKPTFMGGGFPDLTGAPLESQTDYTKKKPKSSEPAKKKTRTSVPAKETRTSVPAKKETRTSVFFVFMHDFRRTYNEEHLKSKSCAEVVKEASKKWKSLTDEEKEQYFYRAAQKAT